MTTADFDPDAYIRATAPLLGLDLDEERIAAMIPFLVLAAEMARTLEEAPVPAGTLALAPVFDPSSQPE